jgi:hypothetical protein
MVLCFLPYGEYSLKEFSAPSSPAPLKAEADDRPWVWLRPLSGGAPDLLRPRDHFLSSGSRGGNPR